MTPRRTRLKRGILLMLAAALLGANVAQPWTSGHAHTAWRATAGMLLVALVAVYFVMDS